MRMLIYTVVGAAALATTSIASAAVTVTGSTGLNNPDPAAAGSIQTVGNTTTINFGQNPVTSPTFSASFVVNNTLAGLYSIVVGTSDPNTFFNTVTFNGTALTNINNNQNFILSPPENLAVGNYTLAITGHTNQVGGSFTGNVTISPIAAVPEAATWAMMLLGFTGMGMVIRRRRRPMLAQIA